MLFDTGVGHRTVGEEPHGQHDRDEQRHPDQDGHDGPVAIARALQPHVAELKGEVTGQLAVPVDAAEVRVRRDQPELVPHVLGDDRGLRIVEDDARLAVHEARALADLRHDRLDAEGGNAIPQRLVLRVEGLALPET